MGLMQGTMWLDQVDFVDTIAAMKPYWFIRTLSGLGMDIGILLMLINFCMTAIEPSPLAQGKREEISSPMAAD